MNLDKAGKLAYWLFLRLVMIFLSITGLFPFLWTVTGSLMSQAEYYTAGLSFFPKSPTLSNYIYVFRVIGGGMPTGSKYIVLLYRNSIILTVSSVALTVLMSALAGYAMARLQFPGRNAMFGLFIGLMFLPAGGTMVALYILMRSLHLLDSMFGLILLHIGGGGTNLFLMRQIFLNIPQDIEDAARVDGAGDWRIAFQIMFPLATAGMSLIAILTFMGTWGSYYTPLIMIQDWRKFTLPIGIQNVVGYATSAANIGHLPQPGIELAALLVMFFPTVVVFVALQKWFIRGAVEGLKL